MRTQHRELVYYVGASLDGYIAGPEGKLDDIPVEPELVEFITTELPEAVPSHLREPFGLVDAPNRRWDTVVMGRGTYEPGLEAGVTSPYSHMEQYVFTATLAADTDETVHFTDADPVAFVRGLKAREGRDIWLAGGGKLAAALIGEIDAMIIKRYPVVLGSGVPLFAGPYRPTRFTLTENRVLGSGDAVQFYRKA
ncbi:dihydrofolate reductase family protein [Glycomyces sp. TRM65418]|uniref:dihydrofolate reductase family protein n=1 Tax=Glycomyces sp. TRM65418 TaxID=2867006 RepID=UPI001CE71548|nr:dihydrofolate reductase family protein [Glycomyces sp. TRM65418]MCC3765125.1 dihydrofolate reductase family protein [Glycomyces sp. TRM65418]QZD54754.1 dihydrofolate reductase family protein [Glycomyces sp. TRM65418]